MINKQLNQLKKLGLSEKESRLYLISLEIGPASIAKLAQKSGIKRGTIYEFLGQMIEKGLLEVSVRGKRKLYCSVEPKKLQKIIERQKEILDSLIPDLALITSKGSEKPKIKFYEGKEGVLAAYNEMIDIPENSEVIGFASYQNVYDIFSKSAIDAYIKKRVFRKIKQKLIMPTDQYSENHTANSKKELRETILIPKNQFPISNEINIYENKVAIISLGEEKIAVIVESIQIADTQRAIFNLLWNSLKKTKKD